MFKYRLVFSKTGRAKFISHLDLMHNISRIFKRAQIELKHSEGFNPHPKISIGIPLSVGDESLCDFLDFETLQEIDTKRLPLLLNPYSPEGITFLKCYIPNAKPSDIKYVKLDGYIYSASDKLFNQLPTLFSSKDITVGKKTKRGMIEIPVSEGVRRISFEKKMDSIYLDAILSAKDPTFNPSLIIDIINKYCSDPLITYSVFTRKDFLLDTLEKFL